MSPQIALALILLAIIVIAVALLSIVSKRQRKARVENEALAVADGTAPARARGLRGMRRRARAHQGDDRSDGEDVEGPIGLLSEGGGARSARRSVLNSCSLWLSFWRATRPPTCRH
jgi:hypothetical protein